MNPGRERISWTPLVLLLLLLGLGAIRKVFSWIIEYQWWKELNQVETLLSTIVYGYVPMLLAGLLAFVLFWTAHARGAKAAGISLRHYPLYFRLSTLGILAASYIAAALTVDNWTAVLYFGGRQLPETATAWRDPVFSQPLSFYLFQLPFYKMLLRVVLVFALLGGLIRAASQLGWSARLKMPLLSEEGTLEWGDLDIGRGFDSRFLRLAAVIFLLALGAERFLDRYTLLTNDHTFMVGIDYVDERVRLPLRWVTVLCCLAAAAFAWASRWALTLALLATPAVVEAAAPRLVQAIYVRPNEISLQRPYIERHIGATRQAYGLNRRIKEIEYKALIETRVDPSRHRALFDNVRLWDWRAFHDTVTQIQALRPYYVFHDTDVDRYRIDGRLQQVMLTPRELDVRQLSADARNRWMNPHFVYTHGYGVVLAQASRITPEGLPVLYIQDAPPQVRTPNLKLTRPELYYGEVVHEPVFVRTGQPEFSYPSGRENVHTRYEGKGGFPISGLGTRIAAAFAYADWNILLTGFLAPESRMMIRRNINRRVAELAPFLRWDGDPYLVISEQGRLVWIIDGYTASNAHPYSSRVQMGRLGTANYIRNAVKATIDAYDGTVNLYIFDAEDPIIQAYARLFPKLFRKAEEMPPDLRAHVRYPEGLFRAQAEIYRTFHMLDPEAFYNKEDAWDIARFINSQQGRPDTLSPTYVVATLPGESEPEFLLLIPFTPRNKDNLIGLMAARCDGDRLGELLVLQLSKQELIFGPMQIEARINQDQNISKDLTLWNQQGSQVLRGQILVLPVENTFVYIVPIYIQASEARMPQLKKVVVAVGNTLIYRDTYDQALIELASASGVSLPAAGVTAEARRPPPPTAAERAPSDAEKRLEQVRAHMRRYRELAAQGKWSEAGKVMEELENALRP